MSLTIDTREWDTAVRQLIAAYGHNLKSSEAAAVIKQSVRLVARDAMKMTPPFGKAPVQETWASQKSVQQNAIKADLLGGRSSRKGNSKSAGVFAVMNLAAGQTYTRKDGTVRLFRKKDGTEYGCEQHLYRPNASVSEMAEHHRKYRTARGRVTTAGSMTRDIGRWVFVDKMIVTKSSMDRYLRHVFKQVGKAKSGFSRAFQALGGKGLPGFVTKHGGGSGIYSEQASNAGIIFTIGNAVNYIQSTGANLSIMRRAIESQTENLNRRIKAAIDTSLRRTFRP